MSEYVHQTATRPSGRITLAAAIMAIGGHATAWAQSGSGATPFQLGTVTVTATRPAAGEVASEQTASVVSREDIDTHNRNTVGDAVNLLPGVTVSTNSRNEQTVYVRGYDPRQAPLFIDGIPVYVPYDGYVDFGRFDTADLAAIQVAKGFSSVAYGPNTLGGAINLVSRRPVKAFEADAQLGFGQENSRRAAVNVGTNQGKWYLQAGAAYRDADGFRMSSSYVPTALEGGGRRDNSWYKDSKVSLKLGLTPDSGDEYALSYISQDGQKGQPPSTVPTARYWQWPYWDKESLYFISRTRLGAYETLRLRLYADNFDNEVTSFTDNTYSTLRTSGQGSVSTGRSIYHDRTRGGSVEIETRRLSGHTVRVIAHHRGDEHEEQDANSQVNANFVDTLRSLSIEDGIALGDKTQLSVGFAHHELHPDKVFSRGNAYALPGRLSANDPQIGLFHDLTPAARLYATVAQKTRLPTLKDRYSARLNTYIENPDLRPEEATNYELGYQGTPWAGAKAEAAVFTSDVTDKIQTVYRPGQTACSAAFKCQMQNVGKARLQGVEFGIDTPLGSQWQIGGNATWMNLKNVSDPASKLTGIPERKLIAHARWRPTGKVEFVALAEHDGGRWASNTVRLDSFTIVNLKAVYRLTKQFTTEVGVTNLTDRNYSLDVGFPNPGRMWFANLLGRF